MTVQGSQTMMAAVNRRSKLLFLCTAALLLCACSKNVVFREYKTFKDMEWHVADKAVFEVEISDTESLNNISLMVRHADSYPYSNIYLFVTSAYPDGKVTKDTMQVVLAGDKGEWLGSGLGDIFDFKVPVKKNVRFAMKGKYVFTFEQAMRVDPLPMILDFGLEIEKVKREQ